MLAQLDLWRVRPELLVRLGYSRWMLVIRHVLRLRWQHYRVSRHLLGIQHILMYRRRPVVVLRSGYVIAMLYSLLSFTGNGWKETAPLTRECTYPDFMKCKPLYFKGMEGVVELTQWFERMETVFRISNCTVENQIKFATCTLLEGDLTWWNSHVRTVGHDVAYTMTWTNLKKMMTDKYCPRGEIKKLEVEMRNLRVKGTDVRYVGSLPDMIYRSVMASKPKTMHDAIEFATELMDKKIRTFTERQSENKRKQDDNQQQQNKRQNTGRAYTARSGEKKPYGGSEPLCSKCNYHHGAKVYAVGRAGTNPDSNVIMGTFLLNNCYASILFDTGVDRSFVSTAFSS
ncbi:hypothetical protein Tco_1484727 [Tanacetum coccineum]